MRSYENFYRKGVTAHHSPKSPTRLLEWHCHKHYTTHKVHSKYHNVVAIPVKSPHPTPSSQISRKTQRTAPPSPNLHAMQYGSASVTPLDCPSGTQSPAGNIAVSLLGGLERLGMKVVESKGEEDWAGM
jgi:hypothetical protein